MRSGKCLLDLETLPYQASTNFTINNGITDKILSLEERSIGKASSLHAIKTASKVPTLICFFLYKSEATIENPHWGIKPIAAPIIGEYLLLFWNFLLMFFLNIFYLQFIELMDAEPVDIEGWL